MYPPNRSRIHRLEDSLDRLWGFYWSIRFTKPELAYIVLVKAMDVQGRIESINEALYEYQKGL